MFCNHYFLLGVVLSLGGATLGHTTPALPNKKTPPIHQKQTPQEAIKDTQAVPLMKADHPFLEALVQTYQTNPTLKAALRNQYAAAEALPTAQAGFRPNVAFEAATQRSFVDNQNTRSKSLGSSHSGKLTLSQSLFAGGGTIAAISAAEAQIMAGYASFAMTEQETLLSAVNAYLNLWLRRFVLDLHKKNVSVKEKTLEQARARLEVGELTLTDIAQAEAELALARSREIVSQSDVSQAEEAYQKVVGSPPPWKLLLPPEVSQFFDLPPDKMTLLRYARDNNPNAVNVRFLALAAKHNIKVAKAQLLPKLDLSGSLARDLTSDESVGSGNRRANSGNIGLTVTVPLYQGGRNWSSFRGARQNATQAKVKIREIERRVNEETVQARERWLAAKDQIEHLTVQVEAVKLSLEGTRQESLVGERTLLDVLEAENKLVEAEAQLAEAQSNYRLQSYTLLSMLGNLTATALKLSVPRHPLKAYVDTLRTTWIDMFSSPRQQAKKE